MPTKTLPKRLVKRLKRGAHRLNLQRMKIIDPRHTTANRNLTVAPPRDVIHFGSSDSAFSEPGVAKAEWGDRIREMNVSRNFPRRKLAIKADEFRDAQGTIEIVQKIVRDHNRRYRPYSYKLLTPVGHAIAPHLIAMEKINNPTVEEILAPNRRTPKATKFFDNLKKKHRVTEDSLYAAMRELHAQTELGSGNVFVLGYKKGKFIFMPVLDRF